MKKLQNTTITNTDKLNLISNLATMISAGIPLLSALTSLAEDAKPNVKLILETMRGDLLKGKHLYESVAKFPLIFDEVSVNIIQSAEQTGTLDVILKDMKEQIKKDIAFNRKIRSALTYPALVILIFFGVLFMILVVVIPKIATVFSQLKVVMPLPTRIMIATSNFLLHQTIFVVAGFAVLVLGILYLLKFHKKKVLKSLFVVPVISQLIRDIDLLRFSRNMHLLLNAGISITSALELTQGIVHKQEVALAIADAKQALLTGKTLSYSLKQKKKIFPGTMIELIQAGEKTGSLERAMHDIYEYFDYKVTDNLGVITALLEPIMLVLVAILVGSMMVAIIGPIYNLIGQIGPR